MFDWCQKVNIYNIENHYHFYNGSPDPKQFFQSIHLSQLKAAPIRVSSSHSSKSKSMCSGKKGLCLSSKLVSQKIHNFTASTQNTQPSPLNTKLQPIQRSNCHSFAQKDTIKTEHSEHFWKGSAPKDQIAMDPKRGNSSRTRTRIQKMVQKQKPKVGVSIHKAEQEPMPLLWMKNLSSTMEATYVSMHKNTQSHERLTREQLNIKDVATSRHLESQAQLKANSSSNSLSKHLKLSENSLIHSESSAEQNIHNNTLQLPPKAGLDQASLMLSQILSRDSQMLSEGQNGQKTSCKKKVLTLWQDQDRQTIISKDNDYNSDASVRVEESLICDHQSRHNFLELEKGKLITNNYTVRLGIELDTGCVVSLKETHISNIQPIAQEIRIYQLLEDNVQKLQVFGSILELYQVQMCGNSYLFIKEPYTETICNLFISMSTSQQENLLQKITRVLVFVLEELAGLGVHPIRFLELEDFVQCNSLVKIHDLSAFRQMEGAPLQLKQIVDHLHESLDF